MTHTKVLLAAALLAGTAPAAEAQVGLAFGIRSVSGDEANAANSDRRGYEFRGFWDGHITPVVGWRAELTGVQMQFQRDDGTQRFQVSENGVEIAAALRVQVPGGGLTGLYALGGPVYSIRAVCGASGRFSSTGRVACDEGETQQFGYQLGVGYGTPISARRDIMFELRLVDNVIAGAGNPVVAFALGFRGRSVR